jgi:hypothetical protein
MSTTVKVGVSETSASQYAGPAKAGDGSTTEQTIVEAPFTEYRNVNGNIYNIVECSRNN